jgi:hypothetical protein
MPGDTVLVVDVTAARISEWDPDGILVATHTTDMMRGMPSGQFDDGRLIRTSAQLSGATTGYAHSPLNVVAYAPGGISEDTIALIPGVELFTISSEGRVYNFRVPFGSDPLNTVRGQRLYYVNADASEIQVRRSDGSLEKLVRRDITPRVVTSDDIEWWRRDLSANSGDRVRPVLEVLFQEVAVPETMPAYSSLHVDDAGNIWAQDYTRSDEGAPRCQIFNPDGRWLGSVQMPERLQVTEIGADYVLGIHRDELDVESVRLYQIEKP